MKKYKVTIQCATTVDAFEAASIALQFIGVYVKHMTEDTTKVQLIVSAKNKVQLGDALGQLIALAKIQSCTYSWKKIKL